MGDRGLLFFGIGVVLVIIGIYFLYGSIVNAMQVPGLDFLEYLKYHFIEIVVEFVIFAIGFIMAVIGANMKKSKKIL
jgi:hypothetical protein